MRPIWMIYKESIYPSIHPSVQNMCLSRHTGYANIRLDRLFYDFFSSVLNSLASVATSVIMSTWMPVYTEPKEISSTQSIFAVHLDFKLI